MVEFHFFPRLPFELRDRIWELAIEPRTVEICIVKKYDDWGAPVKVISPTPVPAILQACRESRSQGLRHYHRAFSLPETTGADYVWVNFRLDMVLIGDSYSDHVPPAERRLIRRLGFEREYNDLFFRSESEFFTREFPNVEEIHVFCIEDDSPCDWYEAWLFCAWPCGRENVKFIDPITGEAMSDKDMRRYVMEKFPGQFSNVLY